MKGSKSFDRHRRAEANQTLLAEWRAKTALEDVPLNQFGESSKETICKMLGFSRSSAASNKKMRDIFRQLDDELAKMHHREPRKRTPTGRSNSGLCSNEVNDALNELQKENRRLSRQLRTFAYLEDTGLDVRP